MYVFIYSNIKQLINMIPWDSWDELLSILIQMIVITYKKVR